VKLHPFAHRAPALALLVLAVVAFAADDARRRVLLVAVDVSAANSVEMLRTLRTTLEEGSEQRIDLIIESLDSYRFPLDKIEAETAALFTKKYADAHVDLVIVWGGAALTFFAKYRDHIWPDGVPLVTLGVSNAMDDVMPPTAGVREVLLDFDVAGTLELARRLQPSLAHVAVVSGTGAFEARWRNEAFTRVREMSPPVELIDLTGRSADELERTVATLPPDSALLYLSVSQPPPDAFAHTSESARRIIRAANAPAYSPFENNVGLGALATLAPDFLEHARAAGRAVLASLASGGSRGVVETTPRARCVADERALARWNIAESALPADCEIRFKPLSYLETHFSESVAVGAIIVVQALLFAGLLVMRSRSRLAARELAVQRQAVEHSARLVTVGELIASITHEINQPLGTIRNNVDSAELLLDTQRPGWLQELRETLADIRRDDQRAASVVAHMRSFLQKHEVESTPQDLNAIVAGAIALVSTDAVRRGVRIETDLEAVPQVAGDRVQLEQVLLNLMLNGMEAMAECSPEERVLLIRTQHDGAGHVGLLVSDRGIGLPDDQNALFKPFFTTKGSGMGLGLSISRAIVEAYEGRIQAANRPMGGVTVTVTLPELGMRRLESARFATES